MQVRALINKQKVVDKSTMIEAQEDPEPLQQPPPKVPLGGHENPRGSVRLCAALCGPNAAPDDQGDQGAPERAAERHAGAFSAPWGFRAPQRALCACVRLRVRARTGARETRKSLTLSTSLRSVPSCLRHRALHSVRAPEEQNQRAGTARLVRACAHAHAYVRTRVRLRARTMRAARAYVCARRCAHAYVGGLLKSSPHVCIK